MVEPKKTIRTVDLEIGESVDLDIIRIFTTLTKINDHEMKGEGINISWAKVDDPKLLNDAFDVFVNFIIKSENHRMALMHAVERAERMAESKIKASSNMVN